MMKQKAVKKNEERKAILRLTLADGTEFAWNIPEKFAWKLFFERWKSAFMPESWQKS